MKEYYTRYPRPILWLIPGGSLAVGRERPGSEPSSTVEVEPFYLSKLPVTNVQYEAFAPDHARGPESVGDHDPVTGVSFDDALAYCRWYATISRKPMRLPTEVEWEHACRAETTGRFFFEEAGEADEYLWDRETSGGRIRPLEDKRPNPHGLYGMLGGVWEWTVSGHASRPPERKAGSDGGNPGALRGGSFLTARSEISCCLRRDEEPASSFPDAGFRIAKSLRR